MATERPRHKAVKVTTTKPVHTGNKYHRKIASFEGVLVTVDVYSVLEAFKVTCPARQHAIKKLLCTGIRGKGDARQDLREAADAIQRAEQLELVRVGND